ncbi:hypothetical protein [Nostoc parmelioides]|uniref:Uncharacterized protein n=1 Tax=Nostoc parmelioides FACHB-3921 TaxID=2692909 RepID=A0ABR8BB10_9NOSO|nr:hypothetical protein [Nostoc parmelioides]MBD2250998.1 hypothetical protein [Nostoc parmelioides FACHB-3921]
MLNSIPNYKNWLPNLVSLWLPRSESLSVAHTELQKSIVTLNASNARFIDTLNRLDKTLDANTQAIAKLTEYLDKQDG